MEEDRLPPFTRLVLDQGYVFFSARVMVIKAIERVESEIQQGLVHPGVNPKTLALNAMAWALMQEPVRGEA